VEREMDTQVRHRYPARITSNIFTYTHSHIKQQNRCYGIREVFRVLLEETHSTHLFFVATFPIKSANLHTHTNINTNLCDVGQVTRQRMADQFLLVSQEAAA
jgi:hypothetical protein